MIDQSKMKEPTYRYRRGADGAIESALFDLALGEPEGEWFDSPAKVPQAAPKPTPRTFVHVDDPVSDGHASVPVLDDLPPSREVVTDDAGEATKQPPPKRGRPPRRADG